MKFKNKISYITLMLLLFSCSESKWAEETTLDPTIKENAIELTAEVQEKSLDLIHAKNMNVYNDSILIILNEPNNETKFVEFYNLNTNKKIADYIGRGNANNEMLMCCSHLEGNNYIVDGFAKKKIAIINLDSVIVNPNYKIPEFSPYSQDSQFITPYGDDDYIFVNPNYLENNNLGLYNNENRFIVQKLNKKEEIKNDIIDAFNISLGFILVNKKNDRVLYFSSSFAEIEVYDFNLNPLKRVIGPDIIEPAYRIEDNSICYNGFIPLSYQSYYADDNNIYVSYAGYRSEQDYNRNLGSYIFKLDWDGNFIESYHSDKVIKKLSKSSTEDTFYTFGYNEDEVGVLYKMEVK